MNTVLLLFFWFQFVILYSNAGKVETNCGKEFIPNSNSQIVFGTSLAQFEHPWFCDFDNYFGGGKSHCSAVLISSEYILTAAHCFDESKLSQHERFIKLRCGSVGNMIDIKALKVIKHSVFADTDMHDLALIKIKEIKYTEYLRPICLMSYEEILEGSKVVAVGSGLQLISLSEDAKKAEITVKSLEICTEIYKHWARSKDNILCAGTAFTGLRGGDSGGPLMANFQGRYYLIGITSAKKIGAFGDTFLQNKYPVLFSRIAPECDSFIGNNSNVKCLKNFVPLRVTEEKELSCGEISESRKQRFFLTNGNDAILQPWFCKLFDKSKNVFCGGTLISFRHLLTAESCLKNIQQSEITIKCGIYFQTTSKISKNRKPENSENDIAILEFKNEINFDGNVGVACLTKIDFMKSDNQQLTVIDQNQIKNFNQKFMKREIENVSTCQTKLNSKNNNTVIICNKEITPLKGGPILSQIDGKWNIVGVISGKNKSNESILKFTKVSNFCDFIEVRGNIKCSNSAATMHLPPLIFFIILTVNFIY